MGGDPGSGRDVGGRRDKVKKKGKSHTTTFFGTDNFMAIFNIYLLF